MIGMLIDKYTECLKAEKEAKSKTYDALTDIRNYILEECGIDGLYEEDDPIEMVTEDGYLIEVSYKETKIRHIEVIK